VAESINDILKEMKMHLPNCLGVAVYSIKDGLIIAENIDFPDYEAEYTSAIHVSIWDTIKNLIILLPDGFIGKINNALLELKSAYFQLQITGNGEFLIMAAIRNKENIGMLRAMVKKFLTRINHSFEE